jgi:hypothetical protein
VLVERLGVLTLRIDHKRIRGNKLPGFQAPRNRATNQQSPQAATAMRRMHSQSSHSKTRHRIPWQLLPHTLIQLAGFDLSGAQTVVAQNGVWGVGVDQHPHDRNALLALLIREAPKVLVQLDDTRKERLTVVLTRVEALLFKHA